MDDCFEKLQEILREVSLELVTEKRREFVSEDYLEEVEERFFLFNFIEIKK